MECNDKCVDRKVIIQLKGNMRLLCILYNRCQCNEPKNKEKLRKIL